MLALRRARVSVAGTSSVDVKRRSGALHKCWVRSRCNCVTHSWGLRGHAERRLKEGAVAVVREGVEIAKVTEPGAVFGELSVLLSQPHAADVPALEASQFHVASAAALLMQDPIALTRRVDDANRALVEPER